MSAILEALRKVERESPQTEFPSSHQKMDPGRTLHQRVKRRWIFRRFLIVLTLLLIAGGGAWGLVRYGGWMKGNASSAIHASPSSKETTETTPARLLEEKRGDSSYSTEKNTMRAEPLLPDKPKGTGSRPSRQRPESGRQGDGRPAEADDKPLLRGPEERPSNTADSPFKLEMLVWSDNPKSRFAVINGTMVKQGDSIQGASVSEIARDSVVLRSADKTWELRIHTSQQ